jgi:hypothetical protein
MSGSSPITKMEEWKEIEEMLTYSISTMGNVRRKSREFKDKFITIKGSIGNRGYRYLQIHLNGKEHRKNLLIHRLVAIAFIPNPNDLPCVDHIDNNPLNNHVSNLRWCCQADNCKNQTQRTAGKINGANFDVKHQRWRADCRANGKLKFLGYYDTYDEAKDARLKWENNYEFYKQGDADNYSNVKGKELKKSPKGSIMLRNDTKQPRWRVILIEKGVKILNKQFDNEPDAVKYLDVYLTNN